MEKLAVITGGSRGLGKDAAFELAKKSIDIVLTYNTNQFAANAVVNELRVLGIQAKALQLDIAKPDSLKQFVNTLENVLNADFGYRRIDYLINNAGIGIHAPFSQTTEEQFDSLVNVHLKGPFFLTQILLPLINDGGRIINVSSGLTRFSLPGFSAYAMMKGGIEVFSRYLAKELGQRKIRVNTLAPGAIETDFNGGEVRDNPETNENIANMTALGRVGLPNDIGKAISLLLSDEAGWITGQRIEASGGMLL